VIADDDRVCDHCHWTYGDISVALIVQLEVAAITAIRVQLPRKRRTSARKANASWFSYANFPGLSHMPRKIDGPTPLHLTTFIKKLAAAQNDKGRSRE